MSMFDKALGYEAAMRNGKRASKNVNKYIQGIEMENAQLRKKLKQAINLVKEVEHEKNQTINELNKRRQVDHVEINRLKEKCNRLAKYYNEHQKENQ